jgi:hypothetical protein
MCVVRETAFVMITAKGKKFHRDSCPCVTNPIVHASMVEIEDARELGLMACKVCKPN